MKGLRKIRWVSWTAKKRNEWVLNKARVKRELLDTAKARELTYYGHTLRKQGSCKEQCQMHAGEGGHARPGWTTPRRGQDSPWNSQSEWQRTWINEESRPTSMLWPTLGSTTAKEQNGTYMHLPFILLNVQRFFRTMPTIWLVGLLKFRAFFFGLNKRRKLDGLL